MSYVVSVFRLVRLMNCLLAGGAVIAGGYLQTLNPRVTNLYLFAFVVMLLCGAGNALNDRLDINADKVNHPLRPIPSGALKPTEASLVAMMLMIAGVLLSVALAPILMAITSAMAVALVLYNFRLKKIAVWGNLVVAALGGFVVVAGGIAAGGDITQLPGALYPAVLGFLLHFAREMTKDVQDMEGDRIVGFATYPIRKNARTALNLAAGAVSTLVLLSLLPVFTGWYRGLYLPIVILTVDVPLLVVLIMLYRETRPTTLRTASLVYKLGMVTGLVAVLLGGVTVAP